MTTTKDHRSTLCRVYAILIELAEKRQKQQPLKISQIEEAKTTNKRQQ